MGISDSLYAAVWLSRVPTHIPVDHANALLTEMIDEGVISIQDQGILWWIEIQASCTLQKRHG